MAESIIKIENLSKQYRLGTVGTKTLQGDIKRWWAKINGKEDPFSKIGESNSFHKLSNSEYLWALHDINLEIKQGEVLGIIGKNGAGKSTLLKIISRITTPTTGSITINGRIASLLEVGTGFHPELSGRENIFINGAILGMTKAEIKGKLDEIIDFSGVELYIDTPVKRYSSGMYVRLAFAVAAHLEPEILVVDEVLAVGDAEFQKKCLGKMKDVSRTGRTVLFVSHNMAAVKTLCSRALVMEYGKLKYTGDVENSVKYYLGNDSQGIHKRIFNSEFNKAVFQLYEISLCNTNRGVDEPLVENEPIELKTKIAIKSDQPEKYHITYHLYNEMGEAMFSFSHILSTDLKKGDNVLVCTFPASFLQSGQYFLSLFVVEDKRQAIFIEKDILAFTVVDGGRELGVYMGREPGYIKPVFDWQNLIE